MKILVSGAGGLVGSALVEALLKGGHEVRSLVRKEKATSGNDIAWEVATGRIDEASLAHWNGPDAVVHLAGESIAGRRWTVAQKRRIRASRVEATQRLADSLLRLRHRIGAFVSASAIGYYGDRGEEILTEESAPGVGFLPDVARDWEAAAKPLIQAGIRVIHLRFGMILSSEGGALRKMIPIFKLGLGGRVGSGQQWVSWISLTDAVRLIQWALMSETARGAYNAVAPKAVRNADFVRTLARSLRRPAFFPVPAFVLRLVFGDMAQDLLLSSQRVVPSRLEHEGFRFEHSTLTAALGAC